MNLSLIYKVYGVFHIIIALVFGFASSMLSQSSGWGEVTIGITTMSEHFGSALFVIGVIAWMLPSWTTEEQLKKLNNAQQDLLDEITHYIKVKT